MKLLLALTLSGGLSGVAAQDLALSGPPQESPVLPRSWALPELARFEGGDQPLIYLTIENPTSETLVGPLPTNEEPGSFPAGYLTLEKDGRPLPIVGSPESHAGSRWRTRLEPGATLTLAVPLECICALPADPLGHYLLVLHSDHFHPHQPGHDIAYPGQIAGAKVEFEIAVPVERVNAIEQLRGADWRSCAVVGQDRRRLAELARLAADTRSAPGLRARALMALGEVGPDVAAAVLAEMCNATEPIVALAALRSFDGGPLAPSVRPSVIDALSHRDLAVRRAAAGLLAASVLTRVERAQIAARVEEAEDELLLHLVERALASN